MIAREILEGAYRLTTYYAALPAGRVGIRIGHACPALDALGPVSWAYVTAFNPGSVVLPEAENRRRQEELIAALRSAGYVFYRGKSAGDAGDWPPEPSLLIAGMTRAEALDLGRRFGQKAIVFGEPGRAAELLWV